MGKIGGIMEFIRHLPTEALIGLIILMIGLLGWLFNIIYNLFKEWFSAWNKNMTSEFSDVKKEFIKVDEHFYKLDRKIDMLGIEQRSTDFALDALISNGRRYANLKEEEKQRLIRDYEFQNT